MILSHLSILPMESDLDEKNCPEELSSKTLFYLQQLSGTPSSCNNPEEIITGMMFKLPSTLNLKESRSGKTPLHLVVAESHIAFTKAFLNYGASLNIQDNNGNTPLHLALFQRNKNLVSLILSRHMPDCSIKNKYGQTALDLANNWEDEDTIARIKQLLINPLFSRSHLNYIWLLDNAFESKENLEAWINRQQNLTLVSRNSWTMLHAAAESGLTELVSHLIEQGANINESIYQGYTPLHLAIFSGHLSTVKLLLEQGATVNDAKGKYQDTPLHTAVKAKNFKMVKFLLNQGANINTTNIRGHTPLYSAWDQFSLFNLTNYEISSLKIFTLIHEKGGVLNTNLAMAEEQQLLCCVYRALLINDTETLLELNCNSYFADIAKRNLLINLAICHNLDKTTLKHLIIPLLENNNTIAPEYVCHISEFAISKNLNTIFHIISNLKPNIFIDGKKLSLLCTAIKHHNNDITKLLANKTTALKTNNFGKTALYEAVEADNLYAAKLLLDLQSTPYYYVGYPLKKRFIWNIFHNAAKSPMALLLQEYKAKHDKAATLIQRAYRKHASKQPTCSICLESRCDLKTTCKHDFHEACLMEWLNAHDTCPVCRSKLLE